MADVNAKIDVNIDTSSALAQLKSLQRQIAEFHASVSKSSETAAIAQRSLQKNLLDSINSIGSFSAEMRTVKTTAESFTTSLEKNKFSMREYFRYAGASTKTFGRLFKSEYDTIGKVAEERVKKLQTQYIKMGRDASGAMRAIAVMPNELNLNDLATKTQIAAQKQQLFNQLVKQGSTNLLNFGKNTQWAGRQLMVGFTIPLAALGTSAARTFMDMEAQAIKFKKVYGDLFTSTAESQQALDTIKELGREFTKYGVAVSDTVGLAADAAAAGFKGLDLQRQTTEAVRLSVLGQIDNQKALETTISLQNAFGLSSNKLAESVDFLNAVENQTVVSLDDITTAIPKVAPVIKGLGGDVKDLAFFMAAMKEGGINASEGANALKSGLAALINPTQRAKDMLSSMGVDIQNIVTSNKGDLKATVIEFAQALDTLSPLNRAKAIEQMFGKFQFARLSTLFQNVIKEGNQASRVLDLASASASELASLSEKELGTTAQSAMMKFKKAVEDLKVALVPVGQAFLQAVTPVIEFVSKILERFDGLSDKTKKIITLFTVGFGAIGPVALMTFGLFANGLANVIKLLMTLRNGYLRLTGQSKVLGEQTQYMTDEQLQAAAAAHSLDQAHATLTQRFTVEADAVNKLKNAYLSAIAASDRFALANPGAMVSRRTKKYADGVVVVPGSGNQDTVPAMLTPGEAVIPKDMAKKYAPLIQGMVAGNIPGHETGLLGAAQGAGTQVKGFRNATIYLQEWINTMMGNAGGQGANISDVIGSLKQSGGAAAAPLLSVIADEIGVRAGSAKNLDEFRSAGDSLINAAIGALEQAMKGSSTTAAKQFIKDNDLEEIIVPAMKDAAKNVKIAGKDISTALANAVDQIKTVGPVGAESGTHGGVGRIPMEGSYKTKGATAFALAKKMNPDVFQTQQLPSSSSKSGFKNWAMMKNIESAPAKFATDWTKAHMAHVTESLTLTAQELEAKISTYVKDAKAKLAPVLSKLGVDLGKELTDGVNTGAQTHSDSKATIKTGKDVGHGLETGMRESTSGVVNAGKQLGEQATSAVNNGAKKRRGAMSPGGDPNGLQINKISDSIQLPKTVVKDLADNVKVASANIIESSEEIQNVNSKFSKRMSGLSGKILGVSSAVTGLSLAASFAGGKIGDFASKVLMASIALDAFTMLLKSAMGAKLLGALGKGATKFAGSGVGQKIGGSTIGRGATALAARAGVGVGAAGAGGAAAVGGITAATGGTALVVIGALAALAAGAYIVTKSYRDHQKELNRFGNAARVATGELEKIGSITSTKLSKTGFESPSVKGQSIEQQSRTAQLEADIKASKELMDRVETLKKATAGQATAILASFGLELVARGMDGKTAQELIAQLAKMSGKGNVLIDAKINLDTVDLNKELSGTVTIFDKALNPAIAEANKGGKDLEKNLNLVAGVAAASFSSVSAAVKQNTITAVQSRKAFDAIKSSISKLGSDKSLFVLKKALVDLNPQFGLIKGNVKSTADAFKLMQVGAMGVDLSGFIAQIQKAGQVTDELRSKLNSVFGLTQQLLGLQSSLAAEEAKLAEMNANKEAAGTTDISGSTEDPILKELRKKQAQLKIDTILKIEKPAEEKFKNEVSGIITQINDALAAVDVSLKINPASIKDIYDIESELKKIDMLGAEAVTPDYRAAQFQVEDLAASTEEYSHQNDLANHALSKLQDQYSQQIDSLQEIGRIQDYLNSQKKRQLSLADAITQGDIAAAAQMAQEMQAAQADFAIQEQQKQLENSPEILALKEQIKENDEIIWDINQKIYAIEKKSIKPVDDKLKKLEREKLLLDDMKADHNTNIAYQTALLRAADKKSKFDGMSAEELAREVELRQAQLELIEKGTGSTPGTPGYTPAQIKAQEGIIAKLKEEIDAITKKLTNITPVDEPITNWFKRQWQNIKDFITEDIPAFFKTLPSRIASAVGNLWGLLKTFGSWLKDQWEEAVIWIQSLPGKMRDAIIDLWGKIKTFSTWLGEQWDAAYAWIQNLPGKMRDAIIDLWGKIKTFSTWLGEQWDNAVLWIKGLPLLFATTIVDLWQHVKTLGGWLGDKWEEARLWLADLPYKVGFAIGATAGAIWMFVQTLGGWLGEKWEEARLWLVDLPNKTQTAVVSFWGKVQTLGGWLTEKWDAAKTWLSELPTKLGTAVGKLWGKIQELKSWLVEKWDASVAWLKTMPDLIKTTVGDLWGKLPTIKSYLAEVWADIAAFVKSLPGKIAGLGVDIWGGIKSGWNAITGGGSGGSGGSSGGSGGSSGGSSSGNGSKPKDTDKDGIPDSIDSTPKGSVNKNSNMPSSKVSAQLNAEQDKVEKALAALDAKQKEPLTSLQVVLNRKGALGYLNSGGMVPKYFAAGGFARGADTIPAMLTPGEFIIKKSAVDRIGVSNLKSINNGEQLGSSVYNYELNVNVRSDANPDDIARTVMSQIRQIDSQRIRGGKF